jgi:trehalose 6-phosphate phosphatase
MTTAVGSKLPHLFQHWDAVAARIRASHHLLVFLDFDGTLVPIAPRPDQVRVNPRTRRTVKRLARCRHVTLALISGRRRRELLHFLPDRRLRYLGLYGWERNGHLALSPGEQTDLFRAHVLLSERLAAFANLWIEPKGASLSVHLRDLKPSAQRRVRLAVRRLLLNFRRTLHLFENLRDLEILPNSIRDKGAAVSDLLAKPAMSRDFPLFFGDDLSDESAFAAVRNGVSVLVGKPRRTHAQFRLRGPAEVTSALTRLEEALP